MTETPHTLLCVANFPANTGFAWTFIETLYARVASRFAEDGFRTLVAYPEIDEEPRTLMGSPAVPFELPVGFDSLKRVRALTGCVKRENVRVLYLPDRPAWHPSYALLRLSGVRHIVVHDHSSGKLIPPTGAKFVLKWLSRKVPGMMADRVLAVSEFVRRRNVEVGLIPEGRVHTVYNSTEVPETTTSDPAAVRKRVDAPPDRPLVACASRAARVKGIDVLLRAFDRMMEDRTSPGPRPFLVYMGDGPYLEELERLRTRLNAGGDIRLTGYRSDAQDVLGAADLCVVPSRWEEAFGLAALEPMARGVPVIASRIGGLPEVVADGETGRLVEPGSVEALASAMTDLLTDPAKLERFGQNARERVIRHFTMDRQIDELVGHLRSGFPSDGERERPGGARSVDTSIRSP